jgi:hypothetical protein
MGRHSRISETPQDEAMRLALRPLHHIERVPVTCYPVTVANLVQQALDLSIPEDAEVEAYDGEGGPDLFFRWYIYADPQHGKHIRHNDTVPYVEDSGGSDPVNR